MMRKSVSVFLLLAVFVTSLALPDDAEARRRRKKRSKTKRAKIINEKKLYERLGGSQGVGTIVDEWMRMNLADQRVAFVFSKATASPELLSRVRRGLSDQLCELADGPCQYKGTDLKKLQESTNVDEEHYLVLADNLARSLAKHDVPEREKNELLGRIGELRSDVMEE